jgi:TPP-dependent pyruvate/acetoin dehydrogenase alpha subunit
MIRIRRFEERLALLFKRGKLPGFVHLYLGEEAVAVGVCSALRDDDRITSTHRGHGHLIAKGASIDRMMAELLGRVDGYCRGKGGSMHIVDFSLGIIGTNGIVGGGIPIGTGAAWGDKQQGRDNVTATFFGDGASNQGVFFEAMNLAAIWALPVIFVCENNQYTEWTSTSKLTAGRIADRGRAMNIPGVQVDGNDVLAVRQATEEAVERGPQRWRADAARVHDLPLARPQRGRGSLRRRLPPPGGAGRVARPRADRGVQQRAGVDGRMLR